MKHYKSKTDKALRKEIRADVKNTPIDDPNQQFLPGLEKYLYVQAELIKEG